MISLLLIFLSSYSQTPVLKNYTIKDGLPSNENYFIFQDSKSFIWICTDAGLVKYDANTFKTFNSTHGMPDNTVFEVKEDKLGRIWYRTFAGSIGYIYNDSVFVIGANEKIIDFHKGGTIASFHVDEELNLYVGRQTLDSIAFLKIKAPYKLENAKVIFPKQSGNSWINIILFSNDEFVYAEKRSSKGQKVLLIDVLKNENELILEDTMPISIVPSALTRILKRGNTLTLGNYNVLNKINLLSKQKSIVHLNNPIINVYGANSNELIIAFRDKGILKYDENLIELPEPLLLENLSCSSIMEDNNAGFWYSTLKNGIFYSNLKNHKMTDVSNGSFKPVYFMKLFGKDKLNISLEGGDCNLFNCDNGVIKYKETLRKVNVDLQSTKSIIQINPSLAFLSCFENNELYNYELKKNISIKNTQMYAYPFTELYHYGKYVMGFNYNRAAVFDTTTFEIKHEISTQDRFTSFAYNPLSGESYFGSMHGLYKFYGQTEMKDKDKVNNFRVKDLEYLDNKLIVATKGFGIVIRFGGSVDTLDVNDGILSNVCEKIVLDGSNFWVSSNLGLTQIRYLGYKHYDIINYPLKDFGTSSLIQDFFIQDSILYFASGHMLYSYPLNEIEKSKTPFYVYKIEVNEREIYEFSDVELNSEENSIKVYFAALYYNFKGNARYRYKLFPDDANWTYLKENVILFPSLSSGEYSLIIQAQKNNGSWIECPQIIKFKINPPFWLRWWFLSLAFILIIGSVIYLTSYINGKKAERELFRSKVKIRLYNLEIKAMKAQMNPHFIFNSLNSIQHFILANENDNAYRYLTKFSKLVRKLLESNENESLSIATEVDILTKYLEIEALRFKESFNYEIKVDSSLETYKMIPHMMIQPFIENAIWHGLLEKKSERVLTISFNLENEKCVSVIIEDNGIGINKSKERPKSEVKEKSLALEFIKERLSLFSSTLDVHYYVSIDDKSDLNGNETGTIVKILLPILKS